LNSGSTAIGGLLRDDGGRFIQAYSANVGDCSITRAELKAIIEGMKAAWNLGIKKIWIQTDSRTAIAILSEESMPTHQHASLFIEFKDLHSRQWEVKLSHVFREANHTADYLANLGHKLMYGIQFFSVPNATLCNWLRYDLFGVSSSRTINNIN
ncbi:Putative ribonuclease H protein At1g65750, partial [Linum perenne]